MWEALLVPLTATVIVWIGLVMDSVPLDARDWALPAIVTSNVLWVRELGKLRLLLRSTALRARQT